MSELEIRVDLSLDSAYMKIANRPVAKTVELGESIALDLDEYEVVVGIEVLSLKATIPFRELTSRFHVPADIIELLRLVQPNIATFVAATQKGESEHDARPASSDDLATAL